MRKGTLLVAAVAVAVAGVTLVERHNGVSDPCPSDAELEATFSRVSGHLNRLNEMMARDDYRVNYIGYGEVVTHGRRSQEREKLSTCRSWLRLAASGYIRMNEA